MREGGLHLGGEQSGHIVCLDHTTTGDGMITALSIIATLLEEDRPLSELKNVVTKCPQSLLNVRIKEKRELREVPRIANAIRSAETTLGDSGRVLVRYSGTEALARVMVEGEEASVVDEQARMIADAVEDALA